MADHAEFAAETERVRNLLNPKPEELKTPKRFIKEGPCIVQEVKHSEHESYLFLFNNVLFVTRKEKDKYKIFIAMTMRSSLKIDDYSTSGADDELATSPNFIVDAGKRKFIFKLEDAEQKDDWKREISAAIEGEYELDVVKPVFREVDGQNVWDVRAGLNPEQLNLLDQFHAKAAARDPALDDELRAWADDACLCRFLRARQWNLQDAYIMIDNTLNWRATERPQDIKYEEIFHAANGDLYISPCRDKNGRIVVYMRPGRSPDDPNVRKQYVRYMSWLMETGTRLLDTPHTAQEKMIWIVDFADSKIQGGMEENIRLSRETINVMQNQYPERLGVGFILNPPLPFYVLWKIVSGFVDPVTNRKINFLKNKKHFHTLLHYISADQLEEPYGGTNKFVFTPEEWKNTYFPDAGGESSGSA